MKNDTYFNKLNRKSIRLDKYDYSSAGMYYITICTNLRQPMFGSINNNKVMLSSIGEKARESWIDIPKHFKNCHLDLFIVMPNHIHGLLGIFLTDEVAAEHVQPRNKYQHIIKGSIGSIIRQYKASIKRWCNVNGHNNFSWQRNYYERIVRNDDELNRIREYIITNPLKWNFDRDNIESENFNMDLDEYYKNIYQTK